MQNSRRNRTLSQKTKHLTRTFGQNGCQSDAGVKQKETFGSFEKIEVKAMECVFWSLIVITKHVRFLGEVEFKLADGTVLKGYVHPMWKSQPYKMKSFCINLKAATNKCHSILLNITGQW